MVLLRQATRLSLLRQARRHLHFQVHNLRTCQAQVAATGQAQLRLVGEVYSFGVHYSRNRVLVVHTRARDLEAQ